MLQVLGLITTPCWLALQPGIGCYSNSTSAPYTCECSPQSGAHLQCGVSHVTGLLAYIIMSMNMRKQRQQDNKTHKRTNTQTHTAF